MSGDNTGNHPLGETVQGYTIYPLAILGNSGYLQSEG